MSKKSRTFDSLKSAAAALKLPLSVIKKAKASGCSAFRSNRVYEAELLAWLSDGAHAETGEAVSLEEQKLREEIRVKRADANMRELRHGMRCGELVERTWVASCIRTAATKLQAFRSRSEAEHPVKLAAVQTGDIVGHRAVVQSIWDEIFSELQALAVNFDGAAKVRKK